MTINNNLKPDELIQERKKRILSPKSFILLLISLVIGIFLIKKLEMDKAVKMLNNADIYFIILACFIYFLSNLFKAIRLYVLLRSYNISLFNLYTITCYHNFFNQIFPARTGELTLVYYLKKICSMDVSKGFHMLFLIRIFDFIVISAFFICSIIIYYGSKTSSLLLFIGVFFFIAAIIILFNIKWIIIMLKNIFNYITKKLKLENKELVKKISIKIDTLIQEFFAFETMKYVSRLVITSILVWITLYTLFFVSIISLGIHIDFIQSIIGSTGGVLTNVLPINSFGSFGTLEAGWTGGFVLVGMNEQDAILSGFAYHLISLSASAIIALVFHILFKLKNR